MAVFRIQHITKYIYENPVSESVNELRIFPMPSPEQEVLQQDLIITGNPEVQQYSDYWGNRAGFFNVLEGHQELKVEDALDQRRIGGIALPGGDLLLPQCDQAAPLFLRMDDAVHFRSG